MPRRGVSAARTHSDSAQVDRDRRRRSAAYPRLKSAHQQTSARRTFLIPPLHRSFQPIEPVATALDGGGFALPAAAMLRSLFILAILVPGLLASVRSRYAALVMYLWFALFRPQDWLWIDITSLRISLVLGALLLLPGLVSGVFPNLTHPLSVGIIMFFLSALVSQGHAVNPEF